MIAWFLRFLERHGRKLMLVDPAGNIMAYRYFLLYQEPPAGKTFWPNLYIHHYLFEDGLDGAGEHHHPWRTFGVILRGGYTENFNGKVRNRRAGNVHWMRTKDTHGIRKAIPGTWTLFGHWFQTGEWKIKVDPCKALCDDCREGHGVCLKGVRPFTLGEMFDSADTGKWRQPAWEIVTPESLRRVRLRKKAAAKVGFCMPESMENLTCTDFKNSKTYAVIQSELNRSNEAAV